MFDTAQRCVKSSVHFNNLGADLIENGDYVRGLACLSSAFQKFKQALDARFASGLNSGKYNPTASVMDIWMRGEKLDTQEGSRRQQNTAVDDAIYDQPISCPLRASNPSEISVAVAITFNLAMAYHLAGLHLVGTQSFQMDSRENLLRQALRLYQYSFRLQRTHAISYQSPLFFMACINNIGMVFDRLGERDQTGECFKHLLSLQMYMITSGSVPLSRFEFFLQNTSRHTLDSSSLGAAAA